MLNRMAALQAVVISAVFALTAQAEPTNFRVGTGLVKSDTDPAPAYMPSDQQVGNSIFAEMPHSENTATRFIMYRVSSEGKSLSGFETQLMWGVGLDDTGPRLYTGPAWHRENIEVVSTLGNRKDRVFNGWGWQLGAGMQYKAVTIDLAVTLRDSHEYHAENKRAGIDKKPTSYLGNLLISYRF